MKPISDTAFYCCGLRMWDAEQPHPICGDGFAKVFMNEQGMEIFNRFRPEWGANVSNAARARYIDDLLRERLAANPELRVIVIGCGFDSRAFRLAGGAWFELDEPELIAYKNERLPAATARNPLRRIDVEFDRESLRDKLEPLANAMPTVFVIEGVTMYITADSLRSTLVILRSLFPCHQVIADLMTQTFLSTYGLAIKRLIAQLGADMIPSEIPALPFEETGYREVTSQEIFGLALGYLSLSWLAPLMRLFMSGLFSGYTVRVFDSGSHTA